MSDWYKIFRNGSVLIQSPEEMRELGRQIGKILIPGEVLGVVGELGAGKTHLTQGIVEGLGCSDAVVSPTFALVHEHTGGRLRVCHFDFYRLKAEADLLGIGWDDYLDGEAVLIVEWANLFPDALPDDTSWLLLEHEGANLRRVSLSLDM